MTNADRYKNWFSSMTGQRITAQDIADQLDISRNATNSRMAKGLTADDIITIARGFDINPVTALQELGHVGVDEIFDHLDDDGKRLVTAAPDELVFYLAQDMLSVDQKLALVRDVLGLRDALNIKSLRHFHATSLLRAGVPVKTVQARLGHSTAVMTLQVYAHFVPDDDARAADAIGGVLAGAGQVRDGDGKLRSVE